MIDTKEKLLRTKVLITTSNSKKYKTVQQIILDELETFYYNISEYYHVAKHCMEDFTPATAEEVHYFFTLACHYLPIFEFILDEYLSADVAGRIKLYLFYKEELQEYEQKLREYLSRNDCTISEL